MAKVIKGIKLTFPDYPLFSEISQKLKTEEIYLQIENQTCYLIRSGTEQLHRLKIGDLSQTKANNFAKWMKELGKKLDKSLKESKILAGILQELTDVEIIEELEKRIAKKTIKLSRYPNQQGIYFEGKDKIKSTSVPLPIEIKPEVNHD